VMSVNSAPTKQAMGIGTNMAWMGCRAIWAVAGSATGRSSTAVKGGLFLLENSAN
jgi:hypothetical protein